MPREKRDKANQAIAEAIAEAWAEGFDEGYREGHTAGMKQGVKEAPVYAAALRGMAFPKTKGN